MIEGLRRSRWPGLAVGLLVLGLIFPVAVRANDFDQFQNARVAYESQNYGLSADLFGSVLRGAATNDRRPIIIESRKYLAATFLFLGRRPEAEQQFVLLLRAAPDYVLDPLAFPEEVSKTFNAVKARMEAELKRSEQERARVEAAERGKERLHEEEERQRFERLIARASTEHVREVRSRWIAMIPFGVGQYQNGHDELGLLLAVGESTLLATSIVSWGLHENLRGQQPSPSERGNARLAEAAFRYTNQISLGAFVAVMLAGVIDAQARFKPTRSFDRPRPLPDDLKHLQLSIGPASLGVAGQF